MSIVIQVNNLAFSEWRTLGRLASSWATFLGKKHCTHLFADIVERKDKPEVLSSSRRAIESNTILASCVKTPSNARMGHLVRLKLGSTSYFESARQGRMSM